MSLQLKLKWLFGGSGITNYRIAKDTNEKELGLLMAGTRLEEVRGND